MLALQILFCILFGYLIGGINPSYIIGRLRGFDIRRRGSGNAGASNAVITMGKAVGIGSAIFDILKATASVWTAPLLVNLIFGTDLFAAGEIAGAACILGHIFPVYMKFRGGKGLAALGGVILAVDWRFFLILLAAEIVFALLADYICVVPISASLILPLCYGFFGSNGLHWFRNAKYGWWGAAILAVASVGILFKHVENIRRILAGKEMHFSFLWSHDKEKEIARVTGEDQSEEPKA